MHSKTVVSLAIALSALTLCLPAHAAKRGGPLPNPDFTKGEPIPAEGTHDWNLGATGARGWLHADRLSSAMARQIRITKVDQGSPADGVLAVGDVILGVDGKPFAEDARIAFAKALTAAESKAGDLALIRWRDGKQDEVVVKLQPLGAYGATAPFDCPKSKRIFEQGCEALAKRIADPGYRRGPIERALNAMALLASGRPEYLPVIRKEAEWAKDFESDNMATWHYGYVMMFLAEYVMVTGDQSVMPGLERIAMSAAEGQSHVGSWGHKFATPEGRLYGYGMMNAPGVPLTTSLVAARAAGVKGPKIDLAIERSAKLLRFYIGKGAVPYGDHAPWIQTHEDNGKCGMAAVLFNLLDEPEGATYFARMSLASHGPERECGHTGNFWNLSWAMPGIAPLGPHATGAWMQEFGSWYFDLARRWDGSFAHLGPAQANNDHTYDWDATGAYLLAYAMPLKQLWLTGKRDSKVEALNPGQAQEVIRAGRGWSNVDRDSAYDQLNMEMLFEALGHWSPVVRERAATAIKRRGGAPVEHLIKLLESPKLDARIGACQALAALGPMAQSAVPALMDTLDAEDLWLRVKAAEALAATGEAGRVALPKMLEKLTHGETPQDPRAMEQRFLISVVFGTMLKKSIEGVDPQLLHKAVVASLQNQDGRARGQVGNLYDQLSFEQIKPLLPAIHAAIIEPAPSGEMFADGVRIEGLRLFAKHRIQEGVRLCIDLMDIQRWNKKSRIGAYLEVLESYGPGAKSVAPDLKQLAQDLRAHSEAKGLAPLAAKADAMAEKLAKTTDSVELRSLKDLR